MRTVHDLPSVRAKLMWLVGVISAIAAIGVASAGGVAQFAAQRALRSELVESQARIVATNASAALAFGDREMAEHALSALEVVDGIGHAALFDTRGATVAEIGAADPSHPLPSHGAAGRHDVAGANVLVVPVADAAGTHGRLEVVYRDTGLAAMAAWIAAQSALLFAAAMALAWWLARRWHPVLTGPIGDLERAMRQVRDTGDYGVRVTPTGDDELGRLADGFNAMLEDIGASQRELQQAQRRAEEASRLKDEFVATVSHELRTPLSPIVAWIQLLRLPAGAAQLDAALPVLERNAKALTLIINDLLDMSRIVSGTMRLELREVDLDATIRAAVETVAPAARGRQIDLQLELVAPAPRLYGDAARLQQVVWNLLSNAVKFTETGGRVSLRTFEADGQVHVEVTDTGIGIAAGFLPFVFDRFRQADGSTSRAHAGLGLGLAIVRQLVELHGGTVAASSDGPGAGSRFVVSLPVATLPPALAPAAEPATPDSRATLEGAHVLVIEDEADMRALIERILAAAGAKVAVAAQATDALAQVARRVPDVVVSDIGLPGVDGYVLLGQLRGVANGPLPAVALTAFARPDERQRAFDAGYQAHLSKPVDPAELVRTVAAAWHGGTPLELAP